MTPTKKTGASCVKRPYAPLTQGPACMHHLLPGCERGKRIGDYIVRLTDFSLLPLRKQRVNKFVLPPSTKKARRAERSSTATWYGSSAVHSGCGSPDSTPTENRLEESAGCSSVATKKSVFCSYTHLLGLAFGSIWVELIGPLSPLTVICEEWREHMHSPQNIIWR